MKSAQKRKQAMSVTELQKPAPLWNIVNGWGIFKKKVLTLKCFFGHTNQAHVMTKNEQKL